MIAEERQRFHRSQSACSSALREPRTVPTLGPPGPAPRPADGRGRTGAGAGPMTGSAKSV